jgi:hypothetical protein
MMNRIKGWRTLIVATIAGIPAFLDAAYQLLQSIADSPEVLALIPASVMPYYTTAFALLMVWMRFVTSTPLGKARG